MRTQKAFDEFLQSQRARNLSRASIKWYESRLRPFITSYPKLPHGPKDVQAFLAGVPGCPETKYGTYRALSTFYAFLRKHYGVRNLIQAVAPPRRPKKRLPPTLEPHEMFNLINSATNPRNKAILALLLDTGIRVSELTGLRKSDIKLETIQVTGKTGQREVPISQEVRLQLLSLVSGNSTDNHYVFHGRSGPLCREEAYRIVRAHMEKAGIDGPKLGPHRIRHAFGRSYLVNGGDLRSLQVLMGHTKISTTERYASLNLSDIIDKHHKFTPLRAAHAAAQESFFNTNKVRLIREAEEILTQKEADYGN